LGRPPLALLISILTGLFFGFGSGSSVHPALIVFAAIREGARGSGYSTRTNRLRSAFDRFGMALAVVLMIGAGLLLRSFAGLLESNPGFNPSSVVAASIWLPVPNEFQKRNPYAGICAPGSLCTPKTLRRVRAIPEYLAGIDLCPSGFRTNF